VEITLWEVGGLGNQLFQYAALRYYARRYHAKMRIAECPVLYAKSFGYPRPCLLSHFSITVPMEERTLFDRLVLCRKPPFDSVFEPLKRALGVQVFRQHHTTRYLFPNDLPLERGIGKLYLEGYWHTNTMVEQVADELRSELVLREPAKGKNLEVLNQIRRSKNPVSLHVRGGDSMLAASNRAPLPGCYYSDAIATFRQLLDDPTFFVFSDDLPFVKQILPPDIRVVLVDHNDDFTAHEDMRLMSSCRHHIIANSTFSWWGAWLSPQPDKIVIAPRQWYGTPDSYYPELMPQTWVLTDVTLESALETGPSLLLR
jgi:hypothetical protein